jgi:ArsR family transcriptional regulator
MKTENVPTALDIRKEPAGCCAPPVRAEDRTRAVKEAPVFAALADEVRLQIVRMLARSPALCACEIQQAFDLGQPTISHHLRVLREAGLVDCEKRGVWAYYFLKRDALKGIALGLRELV